ncbi:uncharacterized protein LOC134204897 [Armigeres subalbatus]|uniref:uncharacterized protein LOC134204897 n=1 Tax=Armigeres subalbatus TaxID=124917 RepID=UPI002ED28EE4
MSDLLKIETVNILMGDTVKTSESLTEENHDPKLQELITKWNLSPSIYAILIQHGFSVEYLKGMDDRSLDDVFSVAKWTGHKCALRQKLVLWQDSVLYQTASTSSAQQNSPEVNTVEVPRTLLSQSNQLKHRLLPTTVTTELFNDILSRNEKGKIVVKHFHNHQCLDATHRKYLAHTIVDYYIANELYFPLPDMAKFAQLIAARFTTELAVIYYNPRDAKADKKHPSGLIYDRFHNRNKKRLLKVPKETESNFQEAKYAALHLSEDDITKQTVLKNWLRNNFAPAEDVQIKWKQSVSLRLRSIINEADIEKADVLSEWPRILDETGYLLIDSDFDFLFGNSEKLFNEWNAFSGNFLNYIRSIEIKDDHSRQLLDSLADFHYQDSRDLVVCYVFQAVVKPTRSSGRKLPTILQAQFDVCCLLQTYDEYIEDLRALRQECETAKVQMTPRIYAIGSIEHIEAFYVVTGKFEYKLPSLLRSLDVIIKLKHVLDYRFPDSCEAFWGFVTRFFYGIEYRRKSKNNQLLQLIAYLESLHGGDK